MDQYEAANLVGCSKDTIARARRAGRLPHSRLYAGRWLVAVDDLTAAGLLRPDRPRVDGGLRAASGGDPEQTSATVELVRAEARIGALEDLVARQDDELRFLRALAADHLKRAS